MRRTFVRGTRRRPMALLKCNDCGHECNGIQGIRGHLRACPARKQAALNEVVEPGEPGTFSNLQVTLGSRLSAEGVEMVLRIYERVRVLREKIRNALPIRKSFDSVAWANGWPTYLDWLDMARDVVRLEMSCECILQRAFVSRDE